MQQNEYNYHKLDKDIEEQITHNQKHNILSPYRAKDEDAVRRNKSRDKTSVLRPSYIRDREKILHLPLYNRYNDKTQVFSLYRNDDITRRGLHMQLVSSIARNIGRMLGLNLELIEAIALGHDVGHTPFGHTGERYLSDLLYTETGRYFNHNVHSTRVLDILYRRNLSLQTLDGILCHNGEFELEEYRPTYSLNFEDFDRSVEECYTKGGEAIKKLVPATLEGCIVRVCDIIAYIGKDRQDMIKAKLMEDDRIFSDDYIGNHNAEMINNLTVDIVNNSLGKDYIKLSKEAFDGLSAAKRENSEYIYSNKAETSQMDEIIKPMFSEVYYKLLGDLRRGDTSSIIYKHHIDEIHKACRYYGKWDYTAEDPAQIVADYIASMTDDYFIDLYKFLFPDSKRTIEYRSYFED